MLKRKISTYDCIIIGGGPAGLSAAIYLTRFMRSVLVVDPENSGRWRTHEVNENYFGFPAGVHAKHLRELGKQQAERFGTQFAVDAITKIKTTNDLFRLSGNKQTYTARSIIFANGVTDNFPVFSGMEACLGKSLFWCITCDGYKTRGKKVVVVGHSDDSVITAHQFLNYTKDVVLITNHDPGEQVLSSEMQDRLKRNRIPVHEGRIQDVLETSGQIHQVTLSSGNVVPAEFVFNLQEAVPNSQLALTLGVSVDEHGYILTDPNQRTSVDRVYAAGDITKPFAHQLITAAHEGSMAGQTANYDLYTPDQR